MDEYRFLLALSEAADTFVRWADRMHPEAYVDHVCYKCSSSEEFDRVRAFLEPPARSTFLHQSFVSERRIAIVRFANPIATSYGPIAFLELSDQRPDGRQKSGFDHFEIVPYDGDIDRLAATLTRKGTSFSRSGRTHHDTWDAVIDGGMKIRIEPERLIEKIKKEEMQ